MTARLFEESLFQVRPLCAQNMTLPEGPSWPHLFPAGRFQLGTTEE